MPHYNFYHSNIKDIDLLKEKLVFASAIRIKLSLDLLN